MKKIFLILLTAILLSPTVLANDKGIDERKFWKQYKISYDKFENQMVYTPKYMLYSDKSIRPTIIEKGKDINFFVSFVYQGYQWIFLDSVTINYNSKNLRFDLPVVQRDVLGGRKVQEIASIILTPQDIEYFREMVSTSFPVEAKFQGSKGYTIMKFKENSDALSIRRMLTLYEHLVEEKN